MNKRLVVFATFCLALSAPAVSAQTSASATQPPEVEVLASAVNAISRMHMEPFSDSTLWEAAIDGLIDALNDPYAELFTPQEAEAWEEETSGNYSGVGLQITMLNDEITVTAVFRGFPADDNGLMVGDVIVGVDEHDASDWDTGMAADSIRGPVGSAVEVRVRRAGYDLPISYDLTRAEVHVPAVYWGVLDGDVGYVIMDRVARNAAREMNEALAELADKNGLVIDLRRNPGGFLDESLMLADLFLKPGSTLASTVQRVPGGAADQPETDSYNDRWPQLVPDLPVVILVDEFTASGAEILAGALQDYDRAVVLGQRTFGKGVVQTVMNLPYGRRLRFTTGSWLTPLGRSLQRSRDGQGRPLPEVVDSLPRIQTASGRSLIAGGGVFPDLVIQDDTLKIVEREFIRKMNEAQFPLGLRITEYGFAVASERRESGREPGLTEAEFQRFVSNLVADGLDPMSIEDPDVRDYLFWRTEMAVAQRMDDIAAEAKFRMRRDPVLTEALRLLAGSGSQQALLQRVDALPEATQKPRG
ncbi:MAG: S41 family peptidase [Gemmatimonadota bacterium]|nr:S41 family peptidase [Gemmatimonadota bacterium]